MPRTIHPLGTLRRIRGSTSRMSAPSLMRRRRHARQAQPVIKIESLSKKYGSFTAVDDVTFTARAGRVTGFLGPNGAGKSTTMRILVGLTPATVGSVEVCGRRYADLPNPGLEVGVLLDA